MYARLAKTLIGRYRSLRRQTLERWDRNTATMKETVKKNGALGFACFGGPPVHFQMVSVKELLSAALA